MTTKRLSRQTEMYKKALKHFRNQFKDVAELTKLYVSDKAIVAGEWIDSKGIINFNSNNFDFDFVVNIY